MPLYHFSEEPDICVFEPRLVPAHSSQDAAYVWAIDDWHSPMYYVPRDCPRACFWPGPETTISDRERWFGGIDARMVIAIESGWLEAVRKTTLYRYTMPEGTFSLRDATAGHWVSCATVEPLKTEPVGDLLQAMVEANVELRVTPKLLDIWERVIQSTLAFSGTRLRNARE